MRSSNGASPPAERATRVLIAGHDLKFTALIREAIATTGATVAEDVWRSHTEHDEAASRAILEHTDTILCEWCLGNAAWYSRNKRPDQRLVVRMHRMELETAHPVEVDMTAVDAMVFVSQHVLEDAVARFGWDRERIHVIPNAIDCERLRRPKTPGARFNLAMIGYVPMLKRLDRALDILEQLRGQEPRFRMEIVGRPPSDFGWVVRRDEEVEAFRRTYGRIQTSELLRGAVSFLPFTTDLPSLFQGVGWIVSTSDVEGHQVTLAEGAASGAVPVILDRPGALEQYPSSWVHETPGEAAAAILALEAGEWAAEQIVAADHVASWSAPAILPRWVRSLGLADRTASSLHVPEFDGAIADVDRQG
jgi:glycosyltransferase involved in cell wall biosynthesis